MRALLCKMRSLSAFLIFFSLSGAMLLSGCQVVAANQSAAPTANPTLLGLIVMLTQTAAAPTVTPTPTVGPTPTRTVTPVVPEAGSLRKPASIGETIAINGLALTVLSTNPVNEVGLNQAPTGQMFLDVVILLENTSRSKMTFSPLLFKLFDAADLTDNQKLDPGQIEIQISSVNYPLAPSLLSGELPAGERVRGHLYFPIKIPEETVNYRLGFDPQSTPGKLPVVWYDFSQPAANFTPPTDAGIAVDKLNGFNQRIENSGIGVTINSASSARQVEKTKSEDGSMLVIIEANLDNQYRASAPYNPEYFKVKDMQGFEYPAITISSESMLPAGRLAPHATTTGRIVFQVPETVRRLMVEYQPIIIFGDPYEAFYFIVDVPEVK